MRQDFVMSVDFTPVSGLSARAMEKKRCVARKWMSLYHLCLTWIETRDEQKVKPGQNV